MSLKKLINGVAIATVAVGSVMTGAGTADARDWGRGHGGGSHVNRWGDVRGDNHERGRGAWAHGGGRHDGWDGERHRDHTGRNIAIGAFAAVLGLALAAESQRVQEQYYDDRD